MKIKIRDCSHEAIRLRTLSDHRPRTEERSAAGMQQL